MASAATQALLIATNLTRANYSADVTAAGGEAREVRGIAYLGRQPMSELWFVIQNWWLDLGAGGNENLTGNAVKVMAALEYNGQTVLAPNAKPGNVYTMADGETFLAGPFKATDFGISEFPAQAQLFPRTDMECAIGEKLPRSGQVLNTSPTSRKYRNSTDATQVAGVGAYTGANNGNGPSVNMIVGRPSGAADQAWAWYGDSIGEGNSDAQQILIGQGYADRAFNSIGGKKVPMAHLGRHGGTLSRLTLNGQTRRIALAQYATHAFIEFGANDLFTATNHITNFQNNMRTVVAAMKAVNPAIKVHAVTVAPRTQSSDKFASAAGQISQGSWNDALIKTDINDWMKNTLVSEGVLAGVFDINAAWGDSGGNAKWLTNGTDYYPIPADAEGINNVAQINGTGTITSATNSTTVTGSGTAFTTEAVVGRFIYSGGVYVGRIASVQSATSLTLEANAKNARSASSFVVAERQVGTHPGPQLNTLAGTALATYIAGLPA